VDLKQDISSPFIQSSLFFVKSMQLLQHGLLCEPRGTWKLDVLGF